MTLDPSTLPGMAGDVTGGQTPPSQNKGLALLMQVAKLLQGTGGALQGSTPQGVSGTPARVGPALPNPPLPVPQGSMTAQIPQLSGQQMPQAPGVRVGGPEQTGGGGFNFQTPKARNAAVVTNAIKGFVDLAQGIHQKKFEQQVSESEQIYQTYLMKVKALEAAKATGDQEQIKAAQQDLQKYAQDKKVQKVLQTVSDPTKAQSPQSVGVQRAMTQSQQKALQEAQLEAIQAEAQAKQAQVKQEEATAKAREAEAKKYEQEAYKASPEGMKKEHEYKMEEERAQNEGKAPTFPVKGLEPTVHYQGNDYTLQQLKKDPESVPPGAAKLLVSEYQTTKKNIDTQFQKQANTFGQQIKMWNTHLDQRQKEIAGRVFGPAIKAEGMYGAAQNFGIKAETGDPQADRQLLDLYYGQPISKMTKEQLDPLIKAQPLLQKAIVAFGGKGEVQSMELPTEVRDAIISELGQRAKTERENANQALKVYGVTPPPDTVWTPAAPVADPDKAPEPSGDVSDEHILNLLNQGK